MGKKLRPSTKKEKLARKKKDQEPKIPKGPRSVLERKLGQLTYQIGVKAGQIQRENKALQELQIMSNGIATEIEKLDGK